MHSATTQPPSLAWSARARLGCVACSESIGLGAEWLGCPRCGEPLIVEYYGKGVRAEELLPVDGALIDLGQGATPLLDVHPRWPRTMLKLEGRNPTGSHKDRFQALSVAIARMLGARGVVAYSTGNHGLACAAFAAAAELPCVVFLHPEAPASLATQIQAHGASVAVLGDEAPVVIATLVDDGWYPSTGADHVLVSRGNPYGQEAYKAIAWEIAAAGSADVVAVPASSGDTLYGIWRGFRDLHELEGLAMPTILACQPEDAASLAPGSVEVLRSQSIALSARDGRCGRHATAVLADGMLIPVPEQQLRRGLQELYAAGVSADPAAALSIVGIELARTQQLVDPDATAVAIITASGLGWSARVARALDHRDGIHRSPAELLEYVDAG